MEHILKIFMDTVVQFPFLGILFILQNDNDDDEKFEFPAFFQNFQPTLKNFISCGKVKGNKFLSQILVINPH